MNQFSKEYLFSKGNLHALGLTFKPQSKAFQTYGDFIVVSLLFTDSEKEAIARNMLSTPPINTFGTLKAKLTHPQDLTEEQEAKLETEGFDTKDIESLDLAIG